MSTSAKALKKFGGPLIKGVELEVKDLSSNKWYQAQIVDSQFFKIQIKYKNFSSQYDTDWISTEKELYRIEPLGTHTVKIEQIIDNNSNNNNSTNNSNNTDEKQQNDTVETQLVSDYFDSNANNSNHNSKKNNSSNGNNKSVKIIAKLESKVSDLETKLQTALKNDSTLNAKVNSLTKENEELKLRAARMSKEIKSLKKMINDLKNDDMGTWEEIE